jgi:hypothetical protein
MVAAWLVLVLFVAIALVACVLMREVRAWVGWAVAALVALVVLYVVADLVRSFAQIDRDRLATERIAVTDVQVDDLRLSGTSEHDYRMSGLLRNLSPTYTLTDVRFDLVVLDCVKDDCHEQSRGHVEVIRRVPPSQSAMFDTSIVSLRPMLSPIGERRFTTRVYLTFGQ